MMPRLQAHTKPQASCWLLLILGATKSCDLDSSSTHMREGGVKRWPPFLRRLSQGIPKWAPNFNCHILSAPRPRHCSSVASFASTYQINRTRSDPSGGNLVTPGACKRGIHPQMHCLDQPFCAVLAASFDHCLHLKFATGVPDSRVAGENSNESIGALSLGPGQQAASSRSATNLRAPAEGPGEWVLWFKPSRQSPPGDRCHCHFLGVFVSGKGHPDPSNTFEVIVQCQNESEEWDPIPNRRGCFRPWKVCHFSVAPSKASGTKVQLGQN